MDNETKELLQELKEAIAEGKKPFIHNILQSVIIAMIVSIPSAIMVGNKFENRLIKIESEQQDVLKDAKLKEKKIDYNFELLEKRIPEISFITIEE